MKSINKIILNNAKVIFETNYFKMSLTLIIVLAIYGGYLSTGFNYLEGFISILSFPIFFTFGILMCFLVISLCTYTYFDKHEYLISRLGTKKNYLKILILNIFIINTFIFILMLIIIIISLNLFPKTGFGFQYNESLHCHNFLYLIFIIIRLFFMTQIISIFSMLLCKIINNKIVIGLNIVLYGSFIACSYVNIIPINSIFRIPLYIGNYLIVSRYESFGIELLCTITYISCLILIIYILFHIVKNRLGDIKV